MVLPLLVLFLVNLSGAACSSAPSISLLVNFFFVAMTTSGMATTLATTMASDAVVLPMATAASSVETHEMLTTVASAIFVGVICEEINSCNTVSIIL